MTAWPLAAVNSREQTLTGFLDAVASERAAPAGGSAVAVVGAVGASLCEMARLHADGQVPAPDTDAEPGGSDTRPSLRAALGTCRTRLLALADADRAVVDALFDTGGAGDERTRRRAVGVPLAVAETCLSVAELGTAAVEAGGGPAVEDAVTGVLLAEAAVRAAVRTARTNLDAVADPSFAATVERRLAGIERAADKTLARATRREA